MGTKMGLLTMVLQGAERYWKTLHALTVPLGYYRFDPRALSQKSCQDDHNEGDHNEEDMQNQLPTVKIENKETLLQLLKNIRPSLEKKTFEPKPYQTTGNTVVKKPAYFAKLDQIEEASQTMNNQNNSDSPDFMAKLKNFPQSDSSTMSTFDVTSLFLSLPHSLIVDGLSSLLNSPAVSDKDQKVVSELFNICLGMNTLEFNGRFFLQIRGSPMGSPLSTIAAEIVIPQSFSNAIYRIPCNDCPQSYVRETGRTIATRVLEHDRNIRSHDRAESGDRREAPSGRLCSLTAEEKLSCHVVGFLKKLAVISQQLTLDRAPRPPSLFLHTHYPWTTQDLLVETMDLNLDQVVQLATQYEKAQEDNKMFDNMPEGINKIAANDRRSEPNLREHKRISTNFKCLRCGGKHKATNPDCPAKDVKCHQCMKNHDKRLKSIRVPKTPVERPANPWTKLGLDIVGPFIDSEIGFRSVPGPTPVLTPDMNWEYILPYIWMTTPARRSLPHLLTVLPSLRDYGPSVTGKGEDVMS
ncbi:hypothetical protein LAZ67_8004025 [Cordylochernes scorpioides]|uniref:Reverse transcriptase domain-containing protein n=1 Tax=Cordylochernes scorpioides TaxID=51811 RepID=A0ABY6KSR8_9ARAC|nr:hypothetical protein LAZ67_8004025 [Cordylochernes scorpioides]